MRIGLITRHLGVPAGLGTYAANLLRALLLVSLAAGLGELLLEAVRLIIGLLA